MILQCPIPSSHIGFTTGAGSRSSPPDDRARQLSGAGPSKGPGLPQVYLFLTDSVDTYTIADITLSNFDVLGKVTTKVDKAGDQFRPADSSAAQALYLSRDPSLTSLLPTCSAMTAAQALFRLTDCGAIAKPTSMVIHTSFIDAAP